MSPIRLPRIRRPRLRHPLVTGLLLAAVATASAGGYGWVRVHPGDTVWSIAERHHTTVAELVALNHLPGNGELIYAGSRLRVPLHGHHGHAAHHFHQAGHRHRSAGGQHWVVTYYTVRAGDSLYLICERFGVSPDRIAQANHLPSNLMVRIGQELRIGHWASGGGNHHGAMHRHRHRAHHHHARRHHHHLRRHHAHRHHRSGPPRWVQRRRAKLARAAVPVPSHAGHMVAATAHRFGIDPRFAMAIAWQESGFNQREVSPIGAIGVMQVVPATGRFVSTYVAHRSLNLMRTRDNITAGVGLLWALLSDTHGNERMAAAGYYQGLSSVRAQGMFADTKRYVADVLALRGRF